MATLISTLGAARFDARGELSLAERLKDCLKDNALAWHNFRLGLSADIPISWHCIRSRASRVLQE